MTQMNIGRFLVTIVSEDVGPPSVNLKACACAAHQTNEKYEDLGGDIISPRFYMIPSCHNDEHG